MRSSKDLLYKWINRLHLRDRVSLFAALDRALVDPPSLCCDGDALCAACDADSAPFLTAGSRREHTLQPAGC
jgi:hypothetical protein